MKKILISIVIIVFLGGTIYFFNRHENGSYNGFDHIEVSDIFSQKRNMALTNNEFPTYYVYFYRSDSPDCTQIKEQIWNFTKKNDVFLINTRSKKSKNDIRSFDWKTFNTNNDMEIGTTDSTGNIVYYAGESKEKYENNKEVNTFDKLKRYEIIVADKEYISKNENAKIGYVYASILTPEIDYSKVDMLKPKIELAGVPTLMKIHGYTITDSYYGIKEISELLSTLE